MRHDSPEVDSTGHLRGGGLHDGSIEEIVYKRGERLELRFKGTENTLRWVALIKPLQVAFCGFIGDTIVSGVYCWRIGSEECSRLEMPEAWGALAGPETNAEELARFVSDWREKASGMFLVFVLSSYGGTIAAICEQVEAVR